MKGSPPFARCNQATRAPDHSPPSLEDVMKGASWKIWILATMLGLLQVALTG